MVKYTMKTIEKWKRNGKTSSVIILLDEAVLRRKRETEWMLKLCIHMDEMADICEDDKNLKMFKSDDSILEKIIPILRRS